MNFHLKQISFIVLNHFLQGFLQGLISHKKLVKFKYQKCDFAEHMESFSFSLALAHVH